MRPLRHALDASLALRHAMGCTVHAARTLFPPCGDVLDQHGAPCMTTEHAVRWATQPRHVQPAEWARRLRLVRGFAQDQSAVDSRPAIPPPDVLPYRPQRHAPALYRADERAQLIEAASPLPSATGLRAGTSATVCGVLAVTGMRSSALVALDRADVALRDALRTMRSTTCRPSRCLPLHRTTQQALWRYADLRDRVSPLPPPPSFFVSEQGTRLPACTVQATFVPLCRQSGVRGPRDSHGPR
jgi:integrase/recombinase XerD